MTDIDGESGQVWGVVFVDPDRARFATYDPSCCENCESTSRDGDVWSAFRFWGQYEISGSVTRWECRCGNTWTTYG